MESMRNSAGYSPVRLALAVLVALVGFWWVFWTPAFIDGYWYALGPLAFGLGSALVALQLRARPRTGIEEQTAPAELHAWLSLVYLGVITAYLLSRASVLSGAWLGAEVRMASLKLVPIVAVWMVVSTVLRSRRGREVLEDERDREIRQSAAVWGRGALVGAVLVLLFTLGLLPAWRLQWATPPAIAFHLLIALLLGWLVECATTVALYWRDRQ